MLPQITTEQTMTKQTIVTRKVQADGSIITKTVTQEVPSDGDSFAKSRVRRPQAPDSKGASRACTNSRSNRLAPMPITPGAEAVRGPDHKPSIAGDEYTVTSAAQHTSPPPVRGGAPSMTPVEAQIVHNNEGDLEEMQEQLQRQGEQLQRVLHGIENAPVATVMDEEALVSMNQKEESSAEDNYRVYSKSTQASSRVCGLKRKWFIVAVAGALAVLVIVCVALGVALSKRSTSPPIDDSGPPSTFCQVLDDGSTGCYEADYPASGWHLVFYTCPSGATSGFQCGTCAIAPNDWEDGDPLCNSCSICSGVVAYDCSNLATGACVRKDCDGNCYSY